MMSKEHYFRSPPYESPLLSHSYCTDAITSREACMYNGLETESGLGAVDKDDLTNSPSLNCNMWATAQPYPRYSVDGVPYQPFTNHVVPHPASSMASRPLQADLGVYNSAPIQRGVPTLSPSSSSSSCSPAVPVSSDTSSNPPLYHKKPGSPVWPHRDSSACSTHVALSITDSPYQYTVGLSSTGSPWPDS